MGTAYPASEKNSGDWANRQALWSVVIDKIATGDQLAMAQLYDETSPLVYSLAVRMLGNLSDAEEVTLDVFTQIWRIAGRYSDVRGTVFAWMMNLTRSRSIDQIRARIARSKSNEPIENAERVRDSLDTPDRLSEVSQQRAKVQAALSKLPADQRLCIELAFFSELSHSELAERLGEPLGTVKTRIRSGILKLRTALGELN